jgi:hypothetical protein
VNREKKVAARSGSHQVSANQIIPGWCPGPTKLNLALLIKCILQRAGTNTIAITMRWYYFSEGFGCVVAFHCRNKAKIRLLNIVVKFPFFNFLPFIAFLSLSQKLWRNSKNKRRREFPGIFFEQSTSTSNYFTLRRRVLRKRESRRGWQISDADAPADMQAF